jgi:hypothetical protein
MNRTPAATRNTSSIALEKPTRNGLASRWSMCCKNEESCNTPLAFPTPPAPPARIVCSTAALAGLLRTAGSASADWNSGVTAMVRNASAILPLAVENKIDRNTATPKVPPIFRKNVADAVATPISRAGTAFCADMMSVCRQPPSPRPEQCHIDLDFQQRGVDSQTEVEQQRHGHQCRATHGEDLVPTGAGGQLSDPMRLP